MRFPIIGAGAIRSRFGGAVFALPPPGRAIRHDRAKCRGRRTDRDTHMQSAMIMSKKVVAPLTPHSTKATALSTKATIPTDHSSQ